MSKLKRHKLSSVTELSHQLRQQISESYKQVTLRDYFAAFEQVPDASAKQIVEHYAKKYCILPESALKGLNVQARRSGFQNFQTALESAQHAQQSIAQPLDKAFTWTDLGNCLSVEEKLEIFESYISSDAKTLRESNDPELTDYFVGLRTMSNRPTKNGKFLLIFLGLVNNRAILMQPPEEVTVLGKHGNNYQLKLSDGTVSEFPGKQTTNKAMICTFLFNNEDSFDKFRSILSLKFKLGLDEYESYMPSPEVKEDVIGDKKSLSDYLQNLATAVKKDSDLLGPSKKHNDLDAVKTIKTANGQTIKIHGNEDDGFRISVNNKNTK